MAGAIVTTVAGKRHLLALVAAFIFGFADSLQIKLQILRVPIPPEFLLMAPYIVTMIVLAGVVGRAIPPAADGQPYEKQ
jgi:simple sugar transport system permease protein